MPASRSTLAWRPWLAAAALLALGVLAFAWRQPLLQSIPRPASLASKVGVDHVAPIPLVAAVSPALEASVAAPSIVERGTPAAVESSPALSALPAQQATTAPALSAAPVMPAASPLHGPKAPIVRHGPAHAAPPAAPAAPEGGRDPDVDLVAALMAHVAGAPAPAPQTGAAGHAAKRVGTAPGPTRAAIDQRVQRCKAAHPDDREASRACRRRVCEGLWGRYPACPVRLMPRAATTA